MAQDRITITIDPEVLEELRARVVVPSVVVAETVRGNGPRDAPVNHVLASVDAIVVAEAAARAPSVVFTTDPGDVRRYVAQADDLRIAT